LEEGGPDKAVGDVGPVMFAYSFNESGNGSVLNLHLLYYAPNAGAFQVLLIKFGKNTEKEGKE
jgi:hypothetical protein